MIERLYKEAQAIGDSKAKLHHRLRSSAACLIESLRVLFPASAEFDFDRKRMLSTDGRYALQWRNHGETSIGNVECVRRDAFL